MLAPVRRSASLRGGKEDRAKARSRDKMVWQSARSSRGAGEVCVKRNAEDVAMERTVIESLIQ